MNLSTPILICDQSEDFRVLLRDMLTKHGFFHIVEATSYKEGAAYLKVQANNCFSIIRDDCMNEEIMALVEKSNSFIVLTRPENPTTTALAARLGIMHFLSFPFSSQKLLEKINQII